MTGLEDFLRDLADLLEKHRADVSAENDGTLYFTLRTGEEWRSTFTLNPDVIRGFLKHRGL